MEVRSTRNGSELWSKGQNKDEREFTTFTISLPHRSFLQSIVSQSYYKFSFPKSYYVITTGQSGASLKIAA